jgi:two-component system OmpR family response regulator
MAESGLAKERSMATREKTLRVLVVDDNRDGADAMGLLVEVHVTYGGTQALDVANAFRPDLMLIDLVMPENGRLRSGHSPSPDCRLRSNENRGHHR